MPIIFNVDDRAEAPETYKLLKFVLLFINNIEFVDNEFKLLNIVVDVVFKLLIDNIELVDNEFRLLNIVVDVVFKSLIDVAWLLTKPNILVDVACKLLIFEFIPNTDTPYVVTLPITVIGLLTVNKELDNVIYEFPEIYQLWIAVLGAEYHKIPAFIPYEYGKVEPVPG